MDSKTNLDSCSAQAEANKIAAGIGDLIRVWVDATSKFTVGSVRVAASTIEDLSRTQCGTGQTSSAEASSAEGSSAEGSSAEASSAEGSSAEGAANGLCASLTDTTSICSSGATRISGLGARSAEPTCSSLADVCRPATDACGTAATPTGTTADQSPAQTEAVQGAASP